MLNNLIKYSLRSFKRQRSYIIINVLGLSIGISCSLLIALFVINEAGYDRYNIKKDRIFRLILNHKITDRESRITSTAAVIGPTMLKEFPEIEDFLRMSKNKPAIIEYNNKLFLEDHLVEADSSFFNFFSIPLLKGDRENVLNSPRKIVLSESTARRIFGDEDPIDKTLKIGSDTVRYMISGVMADVPGNSHFEANIISSFMTNPRSRDTKWLNNSFNTYLLLKPNTSYKTVNEKLPGLINRHAGPEIQQWLNITISEFLSKGKKFGYYLQNLTDIHLDTSIRQQFKETVDPKFLMTLASIAILILLIAAINFTNLSTAQASKRAKKVGIKKIAGSQRTMLISQFLSESLILSFISTIFGLIIIKCLLPWFNNLSGVNLELNLFKNAM